MKKEFIIAMGLLGNSIVGFMLGTLSCSSQTMDAEKKELLSLVMYQDSLIEEISDHCWEEHDCECGWLDCNTYYDQEKILVKYTRKYGRIK